jgi:nucleoside-triphosphatase THEP1
MIKAALPAEALKETSEVLDGTVMNVLLTGERQVGKTTVCKQVIELAHGLGHDPAGMLAPALPDKDGFPVAYHALIVADGEQRLLARADGDLGGPRTGRYSFDAGVLSWVIGRLRRVISQGCDLLIVDEIGPLELEQGEGLAPLLSDLSGGRLPPLLLVVRSELAGRLQKQLPGIPFRTFTVTQDNRQALPEAIVKELFGEYDRGR